MNMESLLSIPVVRETDLHSVLYDGILLVVAHEQEVKSSPILKSDVSAARKLDASLATEIGVFACGLPARKLIFAPTGPIDPDYEDVRIFRETGKKGLQRALKSKVKNLLLVLEANSNFINAEIVTLLGVLEGLYLPLQARELNPEKAKKLGKLGVYCTNERNADTIINLAKILECGLRISRDIGGSDPERMTPKRTEEYVEKLFAGTEISVSSVNNPNELSKEYPLFAAVNRAASVVERHRGTIIFLEYNPTDSSKVEKTLFLVGKGVTYDTGGADLKVGGVMAGMSRDKCGAAAVAGFMWIASRLKPANLRILGAMPMVRNSIGSNSYVADEVIRARSSAVVRVGNTDAEGRMIMADVLCKMKELALNAVDPHLFTIATLTGHACLAVGPYTIAMDNGPAKLSRTAQKIQNAAQFLGEPVEVSTIRREDMAFHKGQTEGEDILQCNNSPSSRTPRGHQGPGGFLILSSGLDRHGSGAEKPLKFTHIDCAGSAGEPPHPTTGAPVLALAQTYLLNSDYNY